MTSKKGSSGVHSYTLKGGKLRPSQIITTFGPGAVVDLPEESVMITGIDLWPQGPIIQETRLQQALGVKHFRAPAIGNLEGDVPCVRFPRNRVCMNKDCSLISWNKKCPDCNSDTYPARLIVICSEGHADDFPWHWWAHRGKKCSSKPELRLINQGRTAALADLVVKCSTCGQQQPLAGALGAGAVGRKCSGKHPWLPGKPDANCNAEPRSVLRGASNVYFSSLLSALSIPPWTSPIQAAINTHWTTLLPIANNEALQRTLILELPEFAGFNLEDVIRAIKERISGTTTLNTLRHEEFRAFRNPGGEISHIDFQIRTEPVPIGFEPYIKRVILTHRLREVRVLRGFTRIDPVDADNVDAPIAPIMAQPQDWLPAVEHRGEGIFIELNEDRVVNWEANSAVRQRINEMLQVYNQWREQRGMKRLDSLLPRLVLIHTLAHLLIRQLSLDCGYSSTSLRERIYAGINMCGLLIYTASADSDGSLGGLVQQGLQDRLGATLRALLENARWCSSDPLCSEHQPLLTRQMKGAACHACCLISETSCEVSNRLLDRALVCDLPNLAPTGFFGSGA
ncbi:MAG: DrmB family protein [Chloroflexaceae bacterium]